MDSTLIQMIPESDQFLYKSSHVKNWHRSWIVFKTFVLYDREMRLRVISGFKPWRSFSSLNAFSFTLPWCAINHGEMDIELLEDEWKLMLDKWVEISLQNPYFEIFDTEYIGLGLRTRDHYHLYELVNEISGFVHIVDKVSTFTALLNLKHVSLVQLVDRDGIRVDGVAYGPIDLINSGTVPRLQFTNFHSSGFDLKWMASIQWGTEIYREAGMEITSPFVIFNMEFAELGLEAIDETRIDLWLDHKLKMAMIPRLSIGALSQADADNIQYRAMQEILVDYDFMP